MQGYREINHTADWEIEVWAPSFKNLAEQAAVCMNELSGMKVQRGNETEIKISMEADDLEMLLLKFLAEILYLGESKNLGFEKFCLTDNDNSLSGSLLGSPIDSVEKEIKAVTFHNMKIRYEDGLLITRILFDV